MFVGSKSIFVNLVNSTLILYSSPKIKKFHLHTSGSLFTYYYSHTSRISPISSWIRFAIRHDVEDLSLKLCHPKYKNREQFDVYGDAYVMPQYLFNNSSLTRLSSIHCSYVLDGEVSWGSLRKLTIEHSVMFNNDVLEKILLGSPLLECLKLKEVEVDRIDVSLNSRLERLVVQCTSDDIDEDLDLHISIPSVKSLEILGYWSATRFRLLNASSLVDVRIEFMSSNDQGVSAREAEFANMVRELLKQINHAKQLTVGSMCIQALSLFVYIERPFYLENCDFKSLNINTRGFHDYELPGIVSLLYASPTLEKLVINFDKVHFQGTLPTFRKYRAKEEYRLSEERRSFSCLLGHLKTVELVGLVERCPYGTGTSYEVHRPACELVEFLLRNASVLEKMLIYPEHVCGMKPSYIHFGWMKWARKLLSIPKASAHAVILLQERGL